MVQQGHDIGLDLSRLNLSDMAEIIFRYKWWVISTFIVGTAVTILNCQLLAPIYRSSTLILVEPQQIPSSYVATTVTTGVDERLHTIRQQIQSRTNLEKIIQELDLYHELAEALSDTLPNRIKDMVKGLLVTWKLYKEDQSLHLSDLNQEGIPLSFIEHMRSNIEVQVSGGKRKTAAKAFTVSYRSRTPTTAMQVTQSLSTFFINEILQVRQRHAEGTTRFLDEQLQEAEKAVRYREAKLKYFKEQNIGKLPSQLNANSKKLDRLQAELQRADAGLKTISEKILLYRKSRSSTSTEPGVEDNSKLNELKEELAGLQSRYNDNYPDIIIIKNQIYELKKNRLNGAKFTSDDTKNDSTFQIKKLNDEKEILERQKEAVQNLIQDYEDKVESTFYIEQKLADITRDYQISYDNYQTLLQKGLSAQMSEDLEKRQQREQFRIIDPANLPTAPDKANQARMIFLGSLISGCIGLGLAFGRAYMSPLGVNRPDSLQGTFGMPVLASIPRSQGMLKEKRLVAVEDTESIVTEQYRVLYTQLDSRRETSHNVFAISSAIPTEGKTVTSLNLAVVMARDFGKRTLLLEGDLKRPAISSYLKTELHGGLVDILMDQTNGDTPVPFANTLVPFADENLDVLPIVNRVWNSSGLLSSQQMQTLIETLKQQYDFVLIDAPPILPLSDMTIIRQVVDGIILVVRADSTPKARVEEAIKVLASDKLVGFVLNDMQKRVGSYYNYRYNYKYSYKE